MKVETKNVLVVAGGVAIGEMVFGLVKLGTGYVAAKYAAWKLSRALDNNPEDF